MFQNFYKNISLFLLVSSRTWLLKRWVSCQMLKESSSKKKLFCIFRYMFETNLFDQIIFQIALLSKNGLKMWHLICLNLNAFESKSEFPIRVWPSSWWHSGPHLRFGFPNLYSAGKKEKEKKNLIIITNYIFTLKQMP